MKATMPILRGMYKALFVAAMAMIACSAKGADKPDWKFLGKFRASDEKVGVDIFYLQSSIRHTSNKHVEVWIKEHQDSDIVQVGLSKADLDAAAQKIASGYKPPFFRINRETNEFDVAKVAALEHQADNIGVKVSEELLWEIRCVEREARLLKGVSPDGVRTKPSEWSHNSPNGIAANLAKLSCRI